MSYELDSVPHHHIYRKHPWIRAIGSAQPPNASAFSATNHPFNTRTIPEGHILLRDIPRVSYGLQFNDPASVSH